MSSLQPAFVPPTPFPPSGPAPRLRSSSRRQPAHPTRTRSRPATAVLAAGSRSSSQPPARSTSRAQASSETTQAGAQTENKRSSKQTSAAVRKPRAMVSPGAPALTPTALKRHLAEQRNEDITVVKVYASYCPSCRGAAAPFRKVVAAYADEDVSFASLDFAADEDFARDTLGVDNLPYFAVFRGTRLVDGAAMGWRGLGSRLIERIEAVRDGAAAR